MNCFAATGRVAVEFSELRGGGAGYAQRIAFGRDLADEADDLRLCGVDAAAGKEQIAHDRIAEVALEPRNSAEAGNQSQAQLRKTKARHFVGDDEIARERQFESAAECDAVDGGMVVSGASSSAFITRWMRSRKSRTRCEAIVCRKRLLRLRGRVRADRHRRRSLLCACARNNQRVGFALQGRSAATNFSSSPSVARADFVAGRAVED